MAETLGALVRELRTTRRMTVRGLAAAAGISPAAVSKWESGTVQPRMPELDAVLDALDCSDAQRREAYSRINAPRALNRIKSLSSPPGGSPLFQPVALTPRTAWFPSSGDLLRCLRLRRGLSQERVAVLLRVRPSTVSRWENGAMLLPERRREACTVLLATSAEERTALQRVFLALPEAEEGQATSRDALDQRTEELHRDVIGGASDLMDLRFLSLEAQLFKQSVAAWSQYLLLKTLTWHAQWLIWQDRDREAGAMAQRALSLIPRQGKPDPRGFRAAQIYASQLVRGDRTAHPGRGLRLLSEWLPQANWPHMEAWAHNIIANYYIEQGQREPALRYVEKANSAAERSGNRAALRNCHYDSAIVLLKAGRIDDACALLDTGYQRNVYHRLFETFVRAKVTLAQDGLASVSGAIQQIRQMIRAYNLPQSYTDRLAYDFSRSDVSDVMALPGDAPRADRYPGGSDLPTAG